MHGTDIAKTHFVDNSDYAKFLGLKLRGDTFLASGDTPYCADWLYATEEQHKKFLNVINGTTDEICSKQGKRCCYEISLQEFDEYKKNGGELARRYIYPNQDNADYEDDEDKNGYDKIWLKLIRSKKDKLTIEYNGANHDLKQNFNLSPFDGSPQTYYFKKETNKKIVGIKVVRHQLNHQLRTSYKIAVTPYHDSTKTLVESKAPHRNLPVAYEQPVPPDLVERIAGIDHKAPQMTLPYEVAERHNLKIQEAYNLTKKFTGMNIPKEEISYIYFLPEMSQIISSALPSATKQIRLILTPMLDIFSFVKITAKLYHIDVPPFGGA